jgi:CBS domain-containing protein
MSTVREIMTSNAQCVDEGETLQAAARRMRDLNVGALPICGSDQKLQGLLTDRDIIVKCIAEGGDPRTTNAGQLAQGTLVWIEADRSVEDAWQLMAKNRVRRLPVLDRERRLIGIVSQGDVARHLPHDRVGELVEAISAAP